MSSWETDVPTYEYRCDKCHKRFSLTLTMKEHEVKRIRCPKCKSQKVTQQIGSFYVQTAKKS